MIMETLMPDEKRILPHYKFEKTLGEIPYKLLKTLKGHTSLVTSVAVLSDDRVVSASSDQTLKVWDIKTGKEIKTLKGHTAPVWSVAVLSDDRVVSASWDKTLKVWDIKTGKEIITLKGHTGWVYSVAVLSDDRVVSASPDKTLKVWDIKTGKEIKTLKGHTGAVWSVTVLSDDRVVSASSDQTLKVWDIKTGKEIKTLKGHTAQVLSVAALSADRVVSASSDQTFKVWDIKTGKEIKTLKGHTGLVYSVAVLSADRVVSASYDQTLKVWDIKTGKEIKTLKGHTAPVLSVAVLSDDRVVSASSDQTLKVWDIKTGKGIKTLKGHTKGVNSLAVLNNDRVVSASDDKILKVWDIKTGKEIKTLKGHTKGVNSLAVLSESQVVSASSDKTLKIWNIETGKEIITLKGHTSWVHSVDVPNKDCIASVSSDRTIKIWNIKTGEEIKTLKGHASTIKSVAVLTNDRIVSASSDQTLKVWDIKRHEKIKTLKGHTATVISVAVLSDDRVVSASYDRTIKVWDIKKGICILTLEGHKAIVRYVVTFKNIIVSVSDDDTIKIWDIDTGKCIQTIEYMNHIYCAGFNRDGSKLFLAGIEGIIYEFKAVYDEEFHITQEICDAEIYTNAKVVLLGESMAGKTCLSHRILDDKFVVEESTHGMRVHKLDIPDKPAKGIEREVWLWDLAGQPEYRLTHQLFLDETSLALVLFDPSNPDDPFRGIDHWEKALEMALNRKPSKILVATKIDRGAATLTQKKIKDFCKKHDYIDYIQTSAKTGAGKKEIIESIKKNIPWDITPSISTPKLFKRLKDAITEIKNSELVVIQFPELRERLNLTLKNVKFQDDDLRTVIRLLSDQGLIKPLDFGDFILLKPEMINAYASAIIRVARENIDGIGCIEEQMVLEGTFDFKDMKRLNRGDEQILLRAVVQTFLNMSLCIRTETENGHILVFPSQYNREYELRDYPTELVTYTFEGHLPTLFTTLVVRLTYSKAFEKPEYYKNAAIFKCPRGHILGLVMTQKAEGEGTGIIKVFFDKEVMDDVRVTFIKYIHEHLKRYAVSVERKRRYVCAGKDCGRMFDPDVIQFRINKNKKYIQCDKCDKKTYFDDLLEQKYREDRFEKIVHDMDVEADIGLDNESKELTLVYEVGEIVVKAGQLYGPYPGKDWGIDQQINFKNDKRRATGDLIYLQLKSGDSQTYIKKSDGKEIFTLKKREHIDYWLKHKNDVYLVIRKSDERIRWMNVSEYLRNRPDKDSLQIVFDAEEFNVHSLIRLRDKILGYKK
jgi:small GTP-binding protein